MASSNLFKSLYSHDNSIQNSGFICLNAKNESDTSFDISNGNGTITDSLGNTLASIPLDVIHADDLSQYNVETRILQPHSCYVLQGQEYGLAKATYYFRIPVEISSINGYENYVGCEFDIIYNQHHHEHRHICIEISEADFTTVLNDYFDKYEIKVTASIQQIKCPNDPDQIDDYLVLQAQDDGYFYFVKNVRINIGVQSEDYPESPFSNEIEDLRYEIVKAIQEYHPVKINEVYDEKTYEVDCKLYEWILRNFEELIFQDNLSTYWGKLKSLQYFEDNNLILGDDTDLLEYQNYVDAVELLADTVYENNSILEQYDLNNLFLIYKVLESLSYVKQEANNRYSDHIWLPEMDCWRIPVMKYPNGAFRGIVLIPDWPEAEDYEYSTLYINHVLTTVNVYIPDKHGCYKKMEMGVMSNAMFKQEAHLCSSNNHNGSHTVFQSNRQLKTDIQDGWDNALDNPGDVWTAPDWTHKDNPTHKGSYDFGNHPEHNNDIVYLGESCYSDKTKIMGLYRYMDYVTENHQWMKVGEAYMAVGKADNPQSVIHNLLSSVMIYNPNDIPVRIKYLIFS